MSQSESEEPPQDWVVAVPPHGEPRFAVLPWHLFQRLVALAEGEPSRALPPPSSGESPSAGSPAAAEASAGPSPSDCPAAATPHDLRQRFAVIVDETAPAVSNEMWDMSFGGSADFEDIDRLDMDPVPPEVLERLLDGDHPVKVFREHRGLTQRELAELAGINATYLSQIETRNRGGSTRVYRRLATALDVHLDDLVE